MTYYDPSKVEAMGRPIPIEYVDELREDPNSRVVCMFANGEKLVAVDMHDDESYDEYLRLLTLAEYRPLEFYIIPAQLRKQFLLPSASKKFNLPKTSD